MPKKKFEIVAHFGVVMEIEAKSESQAEKKFWDIWANDPEGVNKIFLNTTVAEVDMVYEVDKE